MDDATGGEEVEHKRKQAPGTLCGGSVFHGMSFWLVLLFYMVDDLEHQRTASSSSVFINQAAG
jgi:hypothetical protein